ncbi:uncharacterized protein LOC142327708 isoform X2 [Lycorma delicatula]
MEKHAATDIKVNFNHFNNETGTPDGCYIVPNFVHFIRFKGEPISYLHMICYLAAFKNQKPEKIYFHYDNKTTFSGKYWDILKNTPGFMEIVEFNYVNMPNEIFGQKLSDGWREFHGSDITRIRILMQYGGIFLDNDSYLVRSLNDFRRYEMTVGWDDGGQFLGTQVLVAHKDARFLYFWLETYRGAYRSDLWYYNAGERPTVEVLYKKPELVHRVKYLFGVHNSLVVNIFKIYWPEWRYMYALHLLHRHLYILGSFEDELPKVFDENNVKEHGNTFREMALDVYNPDNTKFEHES